MHILIVKHAALGDVVRTSYFAEPLKEKFGSALRLSWITANEAVPLLKYNRAVDDVWTAFDEADPHIYDVIYSLDDEAKILHSVSRLRTRMLVGAFLDAAHRPSYTEDAAEWFDMGLLSRLGKSKADELKKANTRGHAQIFARIFDVPHAVPRFYGDTVLEAWGRDWLGPTRPAVGVNPFAGGRWPSKELPASALHALVHEVLAGRTPFGPTCQIVLLGAGRDREKNLVLVNEFATSRLRAADTDDSPLRLAALIKSLDHMITSDSLPMHLAISQGVRTLAFFAPTSASEIDDFGLLAKVRSSRFDYCSYRPDADNTDISATRIIEAIHA